jgi:DNA primase
MPGIDFAAVRAQVSLPDVLQLLHFQPLRRRGHKLRGPCPLCRNSDPRMFVADLSTNRSCCFSCRRKGNQLELWTTFRSLRFYDGVEDLCQQLGLEVPRIHRW